MPQWDTVAHSAPARGVAGAGQVAGNGATAGAEGGDEPAPPHTGPGGLHGSPPDAGSLGPLAASDRSPLQLRPGGPRVVAVHWLDAGNGRWPGALPVDAGTRSRLRCVDPALSLHLHGTPYMWRSRHRYWLPGERDALAQAAQRAGIKVEVTEYLPRAQASAETHFLILRAFQASLPP